MPMSSFVARSVLTTSVTVSVCAVPRPAGGSFDWLAPAADALSTEMSAVTNERRTMTRRALLRTGAPQLLGDDRGELRALGWRQRPHRPLSRSRTRADACIRHVGQHHIVGNRAHNGPCLVNLDVIGIRILVSVGGSDALRSGVRDFMS